MDTKQAQEAKALNTGVKDGFLVALFAALSTGLVQLLDWVLTDGLGLLDSFFEGEWAWAKPVVIALITIMLKAIDRKKHEDPTPATGLVKI